MGQLAISQQVSAFLCAAVLTPERAQQEAGGKEGAGGSGAACGSGFFAENDDELNDFIVDEGPSSDRHEYDSDDEARRLRKLPRWQQALNEGERAWLEDFRVMVQFLLMEVGGGEATVEDINADPGERRYYAEACRRCEDRIHTRASSSLASGGWRCDFSAALHACPWIHAEERDGYAVSFDDDGCQACGRSNHPTPARLELRRRQPQPGRPPSERPYRCVDEHGRLVYLPPEEKFVEDELVDHGEDFGMDEEEGARLETHFRVGRFCRARGVLFHMATHFTRHCRRKAARALKTELRRREKESSRGDGDSEPLDLSAAINAVMAKSNLVRECWSMGRRIVRLSDRYLEEGQRKGWKWGQATGMEHDEHDLLLFQGTLGESDDDADFIVKATGERDLELEEEEETQSEGAGSEGQREEDEGEDPFELEDDLDLDGGDAQRMQSPNERRRSGVVVLSDDSSYDEKEEMEEEEEEGNGTVLLGGLCPGRKRRRSSLGCGGAGLSRRAAVATAAAEAGAAARARAARRERPKRLRQVQQRTAVASPQRSRSPSPPAATSRTPSPPPRAQGSGLNDLEAKVLSLAEGLASGQLAKSKDLASRLGCYNVKQVRAGLRYLVRIGRLRAEQVEEACRPQAGRAADAAGDAGSRAAATPACVIEEVNLVDDTSEDEDEDKQPHAAGAPKEGDDGELADDDAAAAATQVRGRNRYSAVLYDSDE